MKNKMDRASGDTPNIGNETSSEVNAGRVRMGGNTRVNRLSMFFSAR